MNGNLAGFDANDIEPSQPLEAIPPGWYPAIILDSEFRPTKAGTGQYLQFTFEIIDGDYTGRRQWARLNLDNPNATAVEIAKRDLSAICRAVGVLTPNDSSELHDKPLRIKVDVQKDDKTRNEIKGYEPASGTAAAEPAKAAAAGAKKPWQR